MNRGGTVGHGDGKHDSTVLHATTGTFTGDGTSNRAIPHTLGVIPKLVIITPDNSTYLGVVLIGASGKVFSIGGSAALLTNTASDSTNFYAGDSAAGKRGNENTSPYNWVAIG